MTTKLVPVHENLVLMAARQVVNGLPGKEIAANLVRAGADESDARKLVAEGRRAVRRYRDENRDDLRDLVAARAEAVYRAAFDEGKYADALAANAQIARLLALNEEPENRAVQINLVSGDDSL